MVRGILVKSRVSSTDPITHFRDRRDKQDQGTLTATYFFLPKKHIPMLFQRGGLSGAAQATTLYLVRATSKSLWVCIMLPAARMA